jgi:Dyp-type peroxidase family
MSGLPISADAVELEDIQGLVRFAHGHLKQSAFLLLKVKNRRSARSWLSKVQVTSAVKAVPPPKRALQVALTSEGLRALGVAEALIQGFSSEFVAGMAGDENRSRRLGDVGESEPGQWDWGYGEAVPHVLVMLYGEPADMDEWLREVSSQCAAGFEQLRVLTTADMDGREPFGFIDGISQPRLDWQRGRLARDEEIPEYTNLSCLGEFLLGYPNEYGGYTARPLLDSRGQTAELAIAEDAPYMADLGRNGSYLVFRQLQQDVRGFWQFVDRQAGGDEEKRRDLAETMVGRKLDGKPILDPAGDRNDFDYSQDPDGLRCPLGAHIRRANPRNGDLPPGDQGFLGWLRRMLGFDAQARRPDLIASTRFHRLIRRGREYGTRISITQALAGNGQADDRGLHFICLNANIARQFEFVQSAWIMGSRFAGLKRERDPLLGHRQPEFDGTPTDGFSMPMPDGPDAKVCGLPRFVTVRGGAYFFLPGIRALRYLASNA